MSETIPANVSTWLNALNAHPRAGWRAWDAPGQSVYEGVYCWSEKGDDSSAVGVWGNVVPAPGSDTDEPEQVNWCIYVGDCRDPLRSGLESAEAAQRAAERELPDLF